MQNKTMCRYALDLGYLCCLLRLVAIETNVAVKCLQHFCLGCVQLYTQSLCSSLYQTTRLSNRWKYTKHEEISFFYKYQMNLFDFLKCIKSCRSLTSLKSYCIKQRTVLNQLLMVY